MKDANSDSGDGANPHPITIAITQLAKNAPTEKKLNATVFNEETLTISLSKR